MRSRCVWGAIHRALPCTLHSTTNGHISKSGGHLGERWYSFESVILSYTFSVNKTKFQNWRVERQETAALESALAKGISGNDNDIILLWTQRLYRAFLRWNHPYFAVPIIYRISSMSQTVEFQQLLSSCYKVDLQQPVIYWHAFISAGFQHELQYEASESTWVASSVVGVVKQSTSALDTCIHICIHGWHNQLRGLQMYIYIYIYGFTDGARVRVNRSLLEFGLGVTILVSVCSHATIW